MARILEADSCPEGVDISRVRFEQSAEYDASAEGGLVASCVTGKAELDWSSGRLCLQQGSHLYLPRGAVLRGTAGTQLVLMQGVSRDQALGQMPLLYDEEFLRGCCEGRFLRWVLTSQYLSRRIFLHHDATLSSRSGQPLSWFRTTMFDVKGLPPNEQGQPVFKMSYNYRTEPNICYEVLGRAQVRMAQHPYVEPGSGGQAWGPWQDLSAETTYHLDEAEDGPEQEWIQTPSGPAPRRNKHEVHIEGQVSLFCAFDPAPTGTEEHRQGAYSDYGPLKPVVDSAAYRQQLEVMRRFDRMVASLSWSKALGEDPRQVHPELFELYERGLNHQRELEKRLHDGLAQLPTRRDRTIAAWMS